MSQQISLIKVMSLNFVRFVNVGEIQGNFSCCKELPQRSKRQDIFHVLSSYPETKGLSWEKCVGIFTDGTPSMFGSIRGIASLVKKENPDDVKTHCFIHREVLVSITLGDEMKTVLDNATKWLTLSNKELFTPQFLKKKIV
jgi:hypothetical protein